jgi:hypothetical protein
MTTQTKEQAPDGDVESLNVPGNNPRPLSLAAVVNRVKRAIAERGWAEVRESLTESEFDAVGRCLGVIGLRTHVMIDPERDRLQRESRSGSAPRPGGIYTHEELTLHTDRPSAHWIGWYCVCQDESGGATLLADTQDLADRFTADELDHLSRIHVDYNVRDPRSGREQMCPWPLLKHESGALKLYYVPWLVRRDELDESGLRLLDAFACYVAEKREHATTSVRLEERQSLFIDNRRLLHGRVALVPGSPRHLIRLYIGDEETDALIPGPR